MTLLLDAIQRQSRGWNVGFAAACSLLASCHDCRRQAPAVVDGGDQAVETSSLDAASTPPPPPEPHHWKLVRGAHADRCAHIGQTLWARQVQLDGFGSLSRVVVRKDGTAIVAGEIQLAANRYHSILTGIARDGPLLWERHYSGGAPQALAAMPNDAVATVGALGDEIAADEPGPGRKPGGTLDLEIEIHALSGLRQRRSVAIHRISGLLSGQSAFVSASGRIVLAAYFQPGGVRERSRAVIHIGDRELESKRERKDVLVAMDDRSKLLWFGELEGGELDAVVSAQSDEVYAVGTFSHEMKLGGAKLAARDDKALFAAKLGRGGNVEWLKRIAGSNGAGAWVGATGLALDGRGDLVVAGNYAATLAFGELPVLHSSVRREDPTLSDVFVAKFDPMGAALWARSYGDDSRQSVHALAVDPTGNIVLVGDFEGKITFGTSVLASAGGPTRVSHRPLREKVWAGMITSPSMFVAVIGPNGDPIWSSGFGDHESQRALDVALAQSGGIFVAGTFEGKLALGDGVVLAPPEHESSSGFLARFCGMAEARGGKR